VRRWQGRRLIIALFMKDISKRGERDKGEKVEAGAISDKPH